MVIQPPSPKKILRPIGTSKMDPARRDEILSRVAARNSDIEDKDKWIRQSYSGLMVRRLGNVSEREYKNYAQYLDGGAVYIVVHPAFYPFFHGFRPLAKTDTENGPFSTSNVIDRFLSLEGSNIRLAVMQAQERRMRDFIEFKSTEEKLIIIVVPKNYNTYGGYTYKKYADEYMRYLNEITNLSPSVLFVESRSPNRGYITEENSIRLMEFLLSINAERVYVMGGYIGRCLEDFYKFITEDYGKDNIYVVPEMADISPQELNDSIARAIIRPDGTLDGDTLTKLLLGDAYRIQESAPAFMNLE